MRLDLAPAIEAVAAAESVAVAGRVLRVAGGLVEASGPRVAVGDLCFIEREAARAPGEESPPAGLHPRRGDTRTRRALRVASEVIGFRRDAILLMPLTGAAGITPGALVTTTRQPLSVAVGDGLLGRIVDGLGNPIDGLGPVWGATCRPMAAPAPLPLERRRIAEPLVTGVRAIDALLTCGKGQRLGIFAGSGVGKSVLLGSVARHAVADVNVIALIGERGREVREFLERDLGEGLARSVVVVATSDQPPLVRIKGAMVALTIAEHFRDRGHDVLFMMDSLTRVAMAQREIGLAAGEPPTTKGYTPSVFAQMPRLLERVGTSSRGSITGLFAVLVESDDLNEPISDAARSILDGHVTLSRRLAHMGHYPAVDVLASVSRVMPEVVTPEHLEAAAEIRRVLAVHAEAEDVINLGAYVAGTNPQVDQAIERLPAIRAFLRQAPPEPGEWNETVAALSRLAVYAPSPPPALPDPPAPALSWERGKDFPGWEGSSQPALQRRPPGRSPKTI